MSAELAYVGRGCPVSHGPDMHAEMAATEADPYLSAVSGRIALIDRSRQPIQAGIAEGSGCSVVERVRLAQAAGARAVVMLQTSTTAPQAFSPDGDPAGITIPVIMIDKGDADTLRTALCPSLAGGHCAPAPPITATMRDEPGEWGTLRVVDVTDPAAAREIGVYRTPNSSIFPPKDLDVSSPQRAAVHGQFAVVPWNSDGARVLDLTLGVPREIAAFVPPDVADPSGVLPRKAYVVSVALLSIPTGRARSQAHEYVVISDVNSGIYVLDAPWPRVGASVGYARRKRPVAVAGIH
ncbi:MAG: PA domain-containing protein [Gemmatimonadaceae bacterium]